MTLWHHFYSSSEPKSPNLTILAHGQNRGCGYFDSFTLAHALQTHRLTIIVKKIRAIFLLQNLDSWGGMCFYTNLMLQNVFLFPKRLFTGHSLPTYNFIQKKIRCIFYFTNSPVQPLAEAAHQKSSP